MVSLTACMLSVVHLDEHTGLVVGVGGEGLGLLRGDSGVALDEGGLDTEGQVGMVTGTSQPGGFAGRFSLGMGTGYNFSGPETLGYTAGLRIFNFIMEFKSFQSTNSCQWYSQALVKHLMHSNISISGCISCFEGVEPSRQASAGLIRSIRTTRRQPVDPRGGVRVFRVRVRSTDLYPEPDL
jgi:hypothetical protein